MIKNKIIGVRFKDEDLTLLDQAAQKDMRKRSQFVAAAAIEKARQITT